MDPDQIARLSRKLLRSPLTEDGSVFIHSSDFRKEIARLDGALAESARLFIEEVRSLIPTDFSFSLVFTFNGVRVDIDFEDGNTGSTAGSVSFTSRKSLRKSLQRVDWNELRTEGIEGGGIFDELVAKADDRPPAIPSSAEAAKRNAGALARAFEKIRSDKPLPTFALLVSRKERVEIEYRETRELIVGLIGDCMATGYDILAILERGVAWPFPEIECAKLEAVEQLGPISRAQAERRLL
jgi:hypothetical protein